jgi:hypothetical protein
VFRDNLRYIDAHNAAADAGVHSFRLGLNRFADLTVDEYRRTYLGVRTKPQRERRLTARYLAGDNEELPESVDWRAKGAVTEIKDQGSCGKINPPAPLFLIDDQSPAAKSCPPYSQSKKKAVLLNSRTKEDDPVLFAWSLINVVKLWSEFSQFALVLISICMFYTNLTYVRDLYLTPEGQRQVYAVI